MPESGIQLVTDSLFGDLIQRAGSSPRRRVNYNFHGSPDDNPHRFLNVFLRGSYVAPHRHQNPPKSESFLVLEGRMAVLIFDENGKVEQTLILAADRTGDARGVDLPPGIWHTVGALTQHAVCYEVKPGPWNPSNDKEFAAWAPKEGDPEASEYLHRLLAHIL
jgi:cupin fold WbuC family metalloprotein